MDRASVRRVRTEPTSDRADEIFTEVETLWADHMAASPFPDGLRRLETVSGQPVPFVDADMAGCIMTYLGRGHLGPQRKRALHEDARELQTVLPQVIGDDAVYLQRLIHMADLLQDAPQTPEESP